MDREDFNKVAASGDLIIVAYKKSGKFIDSFNRSTAHVGIYLERSITSFDLCNIIDIGNNDFAMMRDNHNCMYDSIESVTVIKSSKDMKDILVRARRD